MLLVVIISMRQYFNSSYSQHATKSLFGNKSSTASRRTTQLIDSMTSSEEYKPNKCMRIVAAIVRLVFLIGHKV